MAPGEWGAGTHPAQGEQGLGGQLKPPQSAPSPLLHTCFHYPQIVVVWVGTNNHGHTAEQVAGGIKAIVQLVNQRQPQARVVVLVRVEGRGRKNGSRLGPPQV